MYITGIRLSPPGGQPEHITHVQWLDPTTGKSKSATTAAMVTHIEKGNKVRVGGPAGAVDVRVVTPTQGPKHLRTTPDGTPADNLLSLPRKQ